jgi:decaprenylphospho-beta-D-ribofuranose 2-oxidase
LTATTFSSFDRTELANGELEQPDRYRALFDLLQATPSCAFRGSGLSYCLASAGEGVTTVSTRHFNRVLNFDPHRRLLTIEPGFTVGRLVEFALPRASYFPVLPGHPSITVGGCAAFNVHGKTQHNVGHFGDHIEALVLVHPDHGEVHCSRDSNADLFDLTIGGMGLTGYIAAVTLRLLPLPGRVVRRNVHRVANLWEAVDVMMQRAGDSSALYSWNDLNAHGDRFGRGFVYDERFADDDIADATRYRTLKPGSSRAPVNAYTALTSRAFNAAYMARERMRRQPAMSVHDAAFPINGFEFYYSLFGRQGFREYQLIVPHDGWTEAANDVRRELERAALPVTLGSLKLFAGDGSHLNFRRDGVCLTLDVPDTRDSVALFGELDRLASQYEAIVNLSKDSRIQAKTVRELFPGYEGFATALETFDPARRCDSALRRRLEL